MLSINNPTLILYHISRESVAINSKRMPGEQSTILEARSKTALEYLSPQLD